MDIISLLIAFIVALLAGFIGTAVGGMGIVSIPTLLFLGLPIHVAIATNKLGGLGLTLTGLYKYHHGKKVDYSIAVPIAITALIGSVFGAKTLLAIPEKILEPLVGMLILAVIALILFNTHLGMKSRRPTKKMRWIGYLLYGIVGFWGAFFGAGYGIFGMWVLVAIFGTTYLQSAGTRKLSSILIALAAVVIFAFNGVIDWAFGAVYFIGMGTGSYFGAGYSMKKGNNWVRGLLVIIGITAAIKLLV